MAEKDGKQASCQKDPVGYDASPLGRLTVFGKKQGYEERQQQ